MTSAAEAGTGAPREEAGAAEGRSRAAQGRPLQNAAEISLVHRDRRLGLGASPWVRSTKPSGSQLGASRWTPAAPRKMLVRLPACVKSGRFGRNAATGTIDPWNGLEIRRSGSAC